MAMKEMTRYAFISHMEDYMRQLLKGPLHADTDDFLKEYGIDGPKAIEILTMKPNPEDENSAVVLVSKSIKDNGTDENGKRLSDTFQVKCRIPRKDYTKKMRNLYIDLFESNIVEGCPINEKKEEKLEVGKYITISGSKYAYISDRKKDERDNVCRFVIDFGKNGPGITDEFIRVGKFLNNLSRDFWIYMLDPLNIDVLDDAYALWIMIQPKDENKKGITDVMPLKKYAEGIKDIRFSDDHLYEWEGYEADHVKNKNLNEDGEGATSADASGQFVQPLFGKPIKRRTLYITQEQADFIKKTINEEAVMDTAFGDFGYDAPIGDGKKNKGNSFFKAANDHSLIMAKSWPKQ